MSEKRQIARAAGLVATLTVLSRVTGLVRDVVVGYLFGAGMAADAFFVAYRIPNLLRRLVGEGATTAAFVPVFTGYLTTGPRAEADRVARVLFTVMAVVLAVISLVGVVFAGPITRLFAPGFAASPAKLELTIALTRMTFPYVFFIGLVAVATGILNSLRDFTAPALSPVVMNVIIVVVAVALAPWMGVYGLALGSVLGGVAQLLTQMPALRRARVPLKLCWEPGHPAVARVGVLMLPTLFGSAVYQINVLVSTVFASLLPPGSVSYLWYAERLFEFPLGVFAVALGTAALPSFATLARRDREEFCQTVGFALRLVSFVALPAAVGLAVAAGPITSVLFQRGEFGALAAQQTGVAVRYYALGLWSVASVRVLVPAFYALEDTRTPVVTAAGAFLANLAFVVLFIGPLASPPDSVVGGLFAAATRALAIGELRHGGLALATSLAASVNLVLLCLYFRRRVDAFPWRVWLASTVRAGVAALAMVPVVLLVMSRITWFGGGVPFAVRVTWLVLAVGAGAVAFALAAVALGGPEVDALRMVARRRLARRRVS
jgi:putative peptidoglycan lipid II flippase